MSDKDKSWKRGLDWRWGRLRQGGAPLRFPRREVRVESIILRERWGEAGTAYGWITEAVSQSHYRFNVWLWSCCSQPTDAGNQGLPAARGKLYNTWPSVQGMACCFQLGPGRQQGAVWEWDHGRKKQIIFRSASLCRRTYGTCTHKSLISGNICMHTACSLTSSREMPFYKLPTVTLFPVCYQGLILCWASSQGLCWVCMKIAKLLRSTTFDNRKRKVLIPQF